MLAHDFLKKDDRSFTPTSSSRSASYFGILILTKLMRCIGIFFVDILAKSTHVVNLLWMMKAVSSLMLFPVQKPLSSGKSIRKPLFIRICRLSLVNCLIEMLWFYGITFCGPLRSVLVFELSPSLILVAFASIFKGSSTPAKSRGLLLLLVGFVSLMLMDRDQTIEDSHNKTHAHHSGLNHFFYHIINMFGVGDHQGGVFILFVALVLRIGYDSSFRHLAVEIGGPKRLYALVTAFSAVILTPLAVLVMVLGTGAMNSVFEFAIYLVVAALFVMVLDFYAESVCFQHVADPVMASARWSPITMFSCALGLAYLWYSSLNVAEHAITSGVLVTVGAFIWASISLTSASPKHRGGGLFVGISDSGMPLFTQGEAFLTQTSRSLLAFCKETLRDILANKDSRRIFWFLCLNFSFCGVEFLYGFWTNSLGLISDGFHMLFDCSALVMGLVASVMSRWPPSRHFTFGYGRVEVLSGFINALFLCVIAVFILIEALERLFDPPNINTDKLLFIAISGLLVNLFGMYSFHGGDDGHGHSHHGHSHGGGHGHSHGNANMEDVVSTLPPGYNACEWGLHDSKRLKALKMWLMLRMMGKDGLREYINRACDMAKCLRDKMNGHPNIRMFGEPKPTVFGFQYFESGLSEEEINYHTDRLRMYLNESGQLFVTNSSVQGKTIMRMSIGYEKIFKEDMDSAWEAMKQLIETYRERKGDPTLVKFPP